MIGLFFTTCKKYPDGPKFSLRSVQHRLTGTYELDKFIVNGIDSTDLLPPCNIVRSLNYTNSDGHYYFLFKDGSDNNLVGLDFQGDYALINNKRDIHITYGDGSNYGGVFTSGRNILEPAKGGGDKWEIRKLTNEDFWIKATFFNSTYEVHLRKIHSL
jgi:hypothetical protein